MQTVTTSDAGPSHLLGSAALSTVAAGAVALSFVLTDVLSLTPVQRAVVVLTLSLGIGLAAAEVLYDA